MGSSKCVRTLGRPVRLVTGSGRGVGTSGLVHLFRRSALVFVVCVEVRLLAVAHFLGRFVVSGPPRVVGRFGRRVLRRTVAAFSTFSSVCLVMLVRCVFPVRCWLVLVSELESSSQSLVLAMLGSLLFFADGFACIEMALQRYVAGVSDRWTMDNGCVEQLRQGGAWKQLSRGKEPSSAVLKN